MKPLTTPDVYTSCHYTTNRTLLNNHSINVTFHEVLQMDDAAWFDWLDRVRAAVLTAWNEDRVPPRVGMTDAEIADGWDKFAASDPSSVWVRCDDGAEALLIPPGNHSVVNQWFPTMMATKITYSTKNEGLSIYDMFAVDKIWARYRKSYATRHFRRDSFFAYSHAIHTSEAVPNTTIVPPTAYDYLTTLRDHLAAAPNDIFGNVTPPTHGVWLSPATADKDYDGYSTHIKDRSIWTVSSEDALSWKASGIFPPHWFTAVTPTNKKSHYMLRLYETDTRVFPLGFRSFRISLVQYAVNWPALGARALYERYTEGITHPVVWDPSSGWGGRIAGAITSRTRPLYIGCDPNTDHLWVDDAGVQHSKYTEIAAFHASRKVFDPPPQVLFFPCGSEEMQHQPAFQEYRGNIDVVFVSPPYWNRELYSDDPEQSAHKFSGFDDWCKGFLKPTLETAAAWLKPGGVLLWNIADIKQAGRFLPLEQRSIDYAVAAGLVQQETIRLLMAGMPGANRISDEGKGTAKNTCLVKGRVTKFEPIYVFFKPKT
jgi:hypothetical protein